MFDSEGRPVEAVDASYLQTIWAFAPPLWGLLETVAQAAESFSPYRSSVAQAVTASQKNVPKADYLRAFIYLLERVDGIDLLSPPVLHAIAMTATVVIDEPDTVVTYDDVRKSVGHWGGFIPDDSEDRYT